MALSVKITVAVVIGCVAALCLGIVIGYFAKPPGWKTPPSGDEEQLVQKIQDEIQADNIKDFHSYLAKEPHIAGKAREHELAAYVRDTWRKQGLDHAEFASYKVLLSYPDKSRPNKVSIVSKDGRELFRSQRREKPYHSYENHTDAVDPFNAFSKAGDVSGELVYVNYGRAEDFLQLASLGVNVTGKIAIVKYGKIFRGNKVDEAAKAGAIGLIIYSDPADYAKNGTVDVYPRSWWMPPEGVQRGNVVTQKGDQLTPGYPATEHAYRISGSELANRLPKIPCQPIGYGDAEQLLRHLDGDDAPDDWQGGLKKIRPYKLGPGFKGSHNSSHVRLELYNKFQKVTIHNVIGKIYGATEPDRYVLLGNHRDAWVYGAVDPSSGTAAMMEMTRVFGKLHSEGWKPRRTLVFCSWAAEEYGLVGSTEWVEEHVKTLLQRAVAYLNVDSAAVEKYSLFGSASPILQSVLKNAAKKVKDPHQDDQNLYDTWRKKFPETPGDPNTEPRINVLGSGSDFAPFIQEAGIPATDHRFMPDPKTSSYPLYHTLYETVPYTKTYDPHYKVGKAVTQVWAEMGRDLADSVLLPLSVTDYARALGKFIRDLKVKYDTKFKANGIQLSSIESAGNNFTAATKRFEEKLEKLNKTDPLAVRMANDRLMLLERAFMDPAGLPYRPLYRHMLFAPGARNTYAGSVFSGLADLMFNIDADPDVTAKWREVKRHYAVIVFTIQSAAQFLMDD